MKVTVMDVGDQNHPIQTQSLKKPWVNALHAGLPPLLFGLRLWVSVCLALYISFKLELDNEYWAGMSAAVVCQPRLGASLRKGYFRMVGTVCGAVAIVVLTALEPQQRLYFLLGLALWGGVCGFMSTMLRNFASYSAALAGYTAAIIAAGELGATGGANGDAFTLALARASEICIGIASAGIVLAGTDFGGARRRLAAQLATISKEISARFSGTFLMTGPGEFATRPARGNLLRRVIALDTVIDETLGESSDLRPHSPTLGAALSGLFISLSAWRLVARHLEVLPNERGRREAELILKNIPLELRPLLSQGDASGWLADPACMRQKCVATARALIALPADTPSVRLLADWTAEALIGIQRSLNGLALLVDPTKMVSRTGPSRLRVPDLLPSLVNAARVFLTFGAIELFWVVTKWPNGPQALWAAAMAVLLFSPRGEQAYASVVSFAVGTAMAAVGAAILDFAVLRDTTTFIGFCLVIGLVLVPAGALMAQPRQTVLFVGIIINFLPMLAPANQMTYNFQQFCNTALGITVGAGIAALACRLVPPLSPALRARRLLARTLRDFRRLVTGTIPRTTTAWETSVYSCLYALPAQAESLPRAQLLAALSVGIEIIRLRRAARQLDLQVELNAALRAMSRGDTMTANEHLAQLDARLAALISSRPGQIRLRARSSILAISEALVQHRAYFDLRMIR
jgi:uncharacterized membrane protein YccC